MERASQLLVLLALVSALCLQGCSFEEDMWHLMNRNDTAHATGGGTAQLSRESGEGLSLGCQTWGGGPRLVVDVAPASVDGGMLPAQRLVLDTGSSTLAFCHRSLEKTAAYSSTNYISCNRYNPGGQSTGYWGPFVEGTVNLASNVALQASYSIMDQEEAMPCTEGFEGIFGVAFRELDLAFSAEEAPSWAPGETELNCPRQPAGVVKSPLLQKLTSDPGNAKFGIYWSGQAGDDQGKLYLGDAATSNNHYTAAAAVGPAKLGELGWYDITVEKVDVGDTEFTGIECDPRSKGAQCILDTGTPSIVVPKQIYDEFQQQTAGGVDAQITFWLARNSGDSVPVSFDAATLQKVGGISPGAKGTGLILGLPLWSFYYTVISISDFGVTFVPTSNTAAPPQPSSQPSEQPDAAEPWEPQPFPGSGTWDPIPSPWQWRPYLPPSNAIPTPWWLEENFNGTTLSGGRRMSEMPILT